MFSISLIVSKHLLPVMSKSLFYHKTTMCISLYYFQGNNKLNNKCCLYCHHSGKYFISMPIAVNINAANRIQHHVSNIWTVVVNTHTRNIPFITKHLSITLLYNNQATKHDNKYQKIVFLLRKFSENIK